MEENGQLVKFLYNENREAVAEEESDGNVIRYIRRLGLISSDSEKAKTYYHYVSDEQGSITHVINGEEKESGELPQEDVQSRVLNHYEYDAFGNTIRCEEQVHNRFRYTGEQYDPLTGQYYLRARYYNPVSARFTQEDTYYGDGLNLYAYCKNNPVVYYDPSGYKDKRQTPCKEETSVGESGAGESGSKGGSATSRPTWRQSELDAATDFPGYADQKSFINGKEVSYGTKGSVRPDYYKEGFSVDIKNYNIENASGRSNLARNIEKQYYQRIENLPNGTKQSVMIDIRGQSVSDEVLSELYDEIMRRTNNGVEILFKKD